MRTEDGDGLVPGLEAIRTAVGCVRHLRDLRYVREVSRVSHLRDGKKIDHSRVESSIHR